MNFDINELNKYYTLFKEQQAFSRVFKYEDLTKYIEKYEKIFKIKVVGKSLEKREIYSICLGHGKIKIFIWSQMHGDETTGTIAIFEVLKFLNLNHNITKFLLQKLSFVFLPMLNPDGAEIFQRRNMLNLDLNRDGRALQAPETKILFQEIDKHSPNILFNLHDQKNIYNVGTTPNPAVLSFLSPSINKEKSLTKSRKMTMSIIFSIVQEMYKIIPNKIGRYTDEFYPTATGDCLQKLKYPCILFESGYDIQDYQKYKSRKYTTISLITAFYIVSKKYDYSDYRHYFLIPENGKKLFDKIYRDVKIKKNNFMSIVDIALNMVESYNLQTKQLEFKYKIIDIGDLKEFFARENIYAKGKYYLDNNGKTCPKIGDKIEFTIV